MRLLYFQDDGSLAYTEFKKHDSPPYAILSHTWGDGEVTFQDLAHGAATDLSGYRKIFFCGEQAAKHGLKYFWVDTCCIDKQNLAELSKAINSMFRWYREATKCYVYLSDVSVPTSAAADASWKEAFQNSRWFTRGWTLQELIAPASVEFFSSEGQLLGNKIDLENEIVEVTDIQPGALRGRPLNNFTVSERFAWANNRQTSEEEDIAYCLLGIFDVFMPLIYGEGESSARQRLQKAVAESRDTAMLRGIEATTNHSALDLATSIVRKDGGALEDVDTATDDKRREMMLAYAREQLAAPLPLDLKSTRLNPRKPIMINNWHQALCLSRDLVKGNDSKSIFQKAQSSFLEAVFWDEWPNFDSVPDREEMVADLHQICHEGKHSSRLFAACRHIEAFASRWTHFFTLAESVMDVDPEWASTTWTAIRLVFMRCRDFTIAFERLAQMFDLIRENLPSYFDHVLRPSSADSEKLKNQLGKALAFVYADILQFCQDACMMFNTSPYMSDIAHDQVATLLSTPFDMRFKCMLHRLEEHNELFDRERRYPTLEKFLFKVAASLAEREQFIEHKEGMKMLEREKLFRERSFRDAVHNWIQPSDFSVDFDRARKARKPGSCAWLQSEPSYVAWKQGLRTRNVSKAMYSSKKAPRSRQILWLEGPAGYGKTVLSTAIIEDLTDMTPLDPTASHEVLRNGVIYFYFNAQMPRKQSYCDALRGLLIQVIETLQDNAEITDIASLLMGRSGNATALASDAELMDLLLVSATRFSSLAIILDGVEECSDFEKMWPLLSAACLDDRIKCLCLGRPLVPTPSEHVHLVARQSLLGMNRKDICEYLRFEIEALQAAGQLEPHLHSDQVAETLASRADSRFLWASLMISYLRSPALGLPERTQDIMESSRIETLHSLYSEMLRQFESLFPQERSLLTKIFEFLALAEEPLTIEQLNLAISISLQPGRRSASAPRTVDISNTLERLSGPLINVGPDSIVSFAHLSFRAFLLSGEATQLRTPFRVDVKGGTLRIAVVCLSYLSYSISHGPLSDIPDTAADKSETASRLPLSEYSARHWVSHAASALRMMPDTLHELIADCFPLLQQLGVLISKRAALSTWIELCWTYGYPPSVQALWHEFESRLGNTDALKSSMERRISESLHHIRTLAEHLVKLNEEWSHLLTFRPYEIWGASISAFLGPVHWAHNDEASVSVIVPDGVYEDSQDVILKVSKLSMCGEFLGIVTVCRPTLPAGHAPSTSFSSPMEGWNGNDDSPNPSAVDFKDATARYQILQLESGFAVVQQFPIALDELDLREVESTAEGPNFRFPIAFAPDLMGIVVLNTLFWVEDGTLVSRRIDTTLSPPPKPIVYRPLTVTRPRKRRRRGRKRRPSNTEEATPSTFDLVDEWNHEGEQVPPERSDEQPTHLLPTSFYQAKFSPCGQFLVKYECQDVEKTKHTKHWQFTIWKREISNAQSCNWTELATMCDVLGDFTHDGDLAFNPQFQVLALRGAKGDTIDNQTSIWEFAAPSKVSMCNQAPENSVDSYAGKAVTTMVYGTGLLNLHFSPDGYYLMGDHFYYRTVRMVSLKSYLTDAVPVPPFIRKSMTYLPLAGTEADQSTNDALEPMAEAGSIISLSTTESSPSFPSLNAFTLVQRNGVPELSTLRKYADGAVVLKRYSSLVDSESCLLYLPNNAAASTAVSILDNGEENSDQVRMVVSTDFQGSYIWDNPLNRESARIITRPTESIRPFRLPPALSGRMLYEPKELSTAPGDRAHEILQIEDGLSPFECNDDASSTVSEVLLTPLTTDVSSDTSDEFIMVSGFDGDPAGEAGPANVAAPSSVHVELEKDKSRKRKRNKKKRGRRK